MEKHGSEPCKKTDKKVNPKKITFPNFPGTSFVL